VVAENAVERFPLRSDSQRCAGSHRHPICDRGGARPLQFPVDLDHASVTSLNGAELRVITNLRNPSSNSVDQVNQALAWLGFVTSAINRYTGHSFSL
jgi:hypothetical protein